MKVDAIIRDPANPDPHCLPVHALVELDKATGQAKLFAQG